MINIAHIHPMLVHFPLALLPVALGAQLFALVKGQGLFGRSCLSSTGLTLMVVAAAGAIIAAVFGDMALDQAVASGVPMSTLETHEELGQASAILLSILAVAEVWFYRKDATGTALNLGLWLAGVTILVVLLTTAWFGGRLVYESGVNVAPTALPHSQAIGTH